MVEQKKKFKYIIRVANTDIDGKKAIYHSLRKIKGVDYMFSSAICNLLNLDKNSITGELDDGVIKKLDEAIRNPHRFNIPLWMMNRRKDNYDGLDKHLVMGDLKFTGDNDKKRLQRIKSYRGLRLAWGLTVRGQRTKSNFRRNKGKGLGVKRKKGKGGKV